MAISPLKIKIQGSYTAQNVPFNEFFPIMSINLAFTITLYHKLPKFRQKSKKIEKLRPEGKRVKILKYEG